MSNKITASVKFDFKGVTHEPSVEVDLDEMMLKHGKVTDFHNLLATAGGYDFFSYEFEMLQAEPIKVIQAADSVAEFVVDEALNIPAFEAHWRENSVFQGLEEIAASCMGIEHLEDHSELSSALLAAYRLGLAAKY